MSELQNLKALRVAHIYSYRERYLRLHVSPFIFLESGLPITVDTIPPVFN
jgi:hypothetical protein